MNKPKYRNTVEFEVEGFYAMFTDILTHLGGEKTTYPFPTYEALKGMLKSIYWKPTFDWIIDSVRIMNKVQTMRKGILLKKYDGNSEKGQDKDLAFYSYLTDVRYQVRAHLEWNLNRPELAKDRNENKHHNIAKRMIERGGRRDVFLGTRECQGYIKPCVFGTGQGYYDDTGEIPVSLMLHGITYADEAINEDDKEFMTVRLWKPTLINGVIDFIRPEECTIKRHIKKMEIKPFGESYNNFVGLKEFDYEEGEFENELE